ncbi:MAG: TIGR03620 family F420-dependent LLM class oxidoreductase [Rhodospirillaceae bacterium]|nr:MAG: TIGR03620 family F420-dependent LLM class oxidoreductase [Rhodospirillaceae bacterium]
MKIGKLGIWAPAEGMSAADAAAFAGRAERWGYSAMWIPEGFGNALVQASWLLAKTSRLIIATGVANLYARDVFTATGGQASLNDQSGGRFLLGLGVSHGPLVEGVRGLKYGPPIPAMREYLEGMKRVKAMGMGPKLAEKPMTVLAALGPKMLALAAQAADGAHPYNVTPEHTAQARAILGPGKLLCPEQKVLLETDAATARAISRRLLAPYFQLPNYCNNLIRLGFKDSDFASGGSDRLIDALIAWGSADAIRTRIQQHWDAGADHVCIQVLPKEGTIPRAADEKIFELLAPAAG